MATRAPAAPSLRRWAGELFGLPKIAAAPYRKASTVPAFAGGRAALVIPGMLSGDRSTALLRASLTAAGFNAYGWGQRANVRVSREVLFRLEAHIEKLARKTGKSVTLIGWSLGGMYARVLAQRLPELVELLMTLGSPISGDRHANNAWRLYNLINDHTVDNPPFPEDLKIKPPVRTIAVWSSRDGIVAPDCAKGAPDESDRQVEVPYRHFELGSARPAVGQIVEILRQELAPI